MTRINWLLFGASAMSLAWALAAAPAAATTKGLNQIVTPDIQPEGQLSISYQQVDPNIANRMEVQAEFGITKQFEVAVFQGFSPPEQVFNVEYGLVQQPHLLLSTGFANYSTLGSNPQPYLEAGYRNGRAYWMAGAIYVSGPQPTGEGPAPTLYQTQGILGGAYRVDPKLLLQLDYQSGDSNFLTGGFTFNITPNLQFNPAAYVANAPGHAVYGYAVLTWNITVFH